MKKHKQKYTGSESNLGFKRILNDATRVKDCCNYSMIDNLNKPKLTDEVWYQFYLKIKRGRRR